MPMTKQAEKAYKPRREPGSLDDVIYPETREKMRAAKEDESDAKMREQIKEKGFAGGGKIRGQFEHAQKMQNKRGVNPISTLPAPSASSNGLFVSRPAVKPLPMSGMKKGGSVTRADGCISKGHTKGKLV